MPCVFEKQLRGDCGRRGVKKGRAIGVEGREQAVPDSIGHNDDNFVFTSSNMGCHESVLSKEHDLISYQDHYGCCAENRLKLEMANVETERLITRLLQ